MPLLSDSLWFFASFPLLLKGLAALMLDHALGEPKRFHPLVGFGRWANACERRCRHSLGQGQVAGFIAVICAVAPWVGLAFWLRTVHPQAHWPVDVGLLYFSLGLSSLKEHGMAIEKALASGDLPAARWAVAQIVSRDTALLTEEGVARAGTESLLENGNDAVLAALFWFFIGAGPLALLFRLSNTLDAMWGYRNERYARFGTPAARIDDALGFVPARLTALAYAVCGQTQTALFCWKTQAPLWPSPNAGPVMASGAGALGVVLGKEAMYGGQTEVRPVLGAGTPASLASLRGAGRLVNRSVGLWLGVYAMLTALVVVFHV
jgi:adenosylcobinamide-phosphate synthase